MAIKLLSFSATLALIALPTSPGNCDTLTNAELGKYSNQKQPTSITQFTDIQPTDWAYQSLSNLLERYGCVAGYPNITFEGKKAITRFEAAA